MKKIIFLLFCLSVIIPVQAQSTYGDRLVRNGLRDKVMGEALRAMPSKGDRAQDFVPAHWKIAQLVEGDINRDGKTDYVLALELDEKDTGYIDSLKKLDKNDWWVNEPSIVLVADSRGDGRLHVGEVNYRFLEGEDGRSLRLEIKKDVLNVYVNYGGSLQTDVTFRFRSPPAGGFLSLIGFEYETFCASCDNGSPLRHKVSENYLTETRVETDYKQEGGKLIGTDKQIKISPVKVGFHDARINESNNTGEVRPF